MLNRTRAINNFFAQFILHLRLLFPIKYVPSYRLYLRKGLQELKIPQGHHSLLGLEISKQALKFRHSIFTEHRLCSFLAMVSKRQVKGSVSKQKNETSRCRPNGTKMQAGKSLGSLLIDKVGIVIRPLDEALLEEILQAGRSVKPAAKVQSSPSQAVL